MSTVTHEGSDAEYHAATDPGHDEHHPSDAKYWQVGGILAVLTALEVSTYFITSDPYNHDLKWLIIGGLLVMMVAKFTTICAYFMHLKFDNRMFRNLFISGLVLAVAVYLVVITTFEFWSQNYEQGLRMLG